MSSLFPCVTGQEFNVQRVPDFAHPCEGCALKGQSIEIQMNYKWYNSTEPKKEMNLL